MQRQLSLLVLGLSVIVAAGTFAVHSRRSNADDQKPQAEKASTKAGKVKKIGTIEGITEYELDNGLKVLLFPDPSKPKVTVNLTIFVGSRHEGYGEAGMAHLLEHMVFKGTPTHPQVPKELQSRGADFNGTTWLDRTNYYETLTATDENLEFAIKLEADRMVNSFIKPEDLASEMTVVRNEFEQGENSPSSVLVQRMEAAAFEWHNYGKSTIGNRADIERVPADRLKVFYKKYYQPDNAMLVVSGQFDEEKALEYIETYFGAIPRPERKLENTYTEEPPQDGERVVTLRRVGQLGMVGAIYKIPAGPHPDFVPVDVLETILANRPSGRLYKSLVETRKATRVQGAAYALHDPGMLLFLAEVAPGVDSQLVLDTMTEEIESIGEKGVTEKEVKRAQAKLLKQRELDAADSKQTAIDLSDWAAQGDWRLYFVYRDRLETVTPEDVQRVAKAFLRRNNRTVGVYVPTKEAQRVALPETPELEKMLAGYKGREDLAGGEASEIDPLAIEKNIERSKIDGVEVALLPKKTRGSAVQLRLTLKYGNEANLSGLARASELLPSLMRRATKKLDREALQDELDLNRADFTATGSAGEATFIISTKRQFLPEVLGLMKQVLREPALTEKDFEILRQEQIAAVERRLKEPQSLAFNAVRRKVSPYPKEHPKYVPTLDEEIDLYKELTVDDLQRLYKEYLGTSDGELAVVGDFSPQEVLPMLKEILADWKPSQPYARLKVKAFDVEGSDEEILTPDKSNAVYIGAEIFPLRDDHPDYPALVLGNYILGGSGGLSSRLGDRIRQQEGLSYGVGSSFAADSLDPRASFNLFAISNPVNVPKVKTCMVEEIERLLKDGVTERELEQAKQGYLQNEAVDRTDDATLASTINDESEAGRTLKFTAEFEKQIEAVTAEEVHAAMKKYVDPKKLVIVTAGDFEKARATP